MFLRPICFSMSLFVALAALSGASLPAAEPKADSTTAGDTADATVMVPGSGFLEIDKLSTLAKQSFTPVDKANLAAAKKNLLDAIAVLDKRLAEDGDNGKAWKAFLMLDELKSQLDGKDAPKTSVLTKIYERFSSDNEGLGLIWFVDVRRALWRYQIVASSIDNPKVKAGYDKLLGELTKQLEEYTKNPTANRARELGEVIAWMEAIGQAETLITAIRNEYCRPNLFLGASDKLIAMGMSRDVDETAPVTDCILGMSIHGTGHTKGDITVELIPNGEEAIVQMTLEGVTKSDNIGSRGVVRVYSDSVTKFKAQKRFFVNAKKIRSQPATCEAVTKSKIKGIRATNGMRLIEKIARKRVQKNHYRGDQIGSRHAEERIARQFNERAKEILIKANKDYKKRFRHPLWRRGIFPNELLFTTAETGLDAMVLQAEANQLAALTTPPDLQGSPDIAIRLHESLINNLAAEALAGRTLNEEQMAAILKDTLGKIPEHVKREEGEEPWSITFAYVHPVVVRFDGGGFSIKLAIDGFSRGDSDYPGMDITAHYKIKKTSDGYRGIRKGDVTILPPGFEIGKDTRLSIRQQTLRELIGRRVDRAFEKEIIPKPLELAGRWKKLGKLPLSYWQTTNGWIVTTWKLNEQKPTKPE